MQYKILCPQNTYLWVYFDLAQTVYLVPVVTPFIPDVPHTYTDHFTNISQTCLNSKSVTVVFELQDLMIKTAIYGPTLCVFVIWKMLCTAVLYFIDLCSL